jgi:hypothetical protein
MRQSQAAQLAAAQSPAEQEADDLAFAAALLFHFTFLALALFTFVTFAEQVSQEHAAKPSTAHHPTTNQEADNLTFVATLLFHFAFLALALFTFVTFAEQVSQD